MTAVLDSVAPQKGRRLAQETGAVFCSTVDELLETSPEYVIEAASGTALRQIAIPCLRAGANLVVLSSGAFADERFLNEVIETARECSKKIYIASGAIGGFDVAQAAQIAGDLQVTMTTEKPPRALQGAPGLKGAILSEDPKSEVQEVFRGTARQAISCFPKNVNVVASLSLATLGLDQVSMTVNSNPSLTSNRHIVVLEGIFGMARIEIQAKPSPNNPQSSLLAAYSVLSLLKKIQSPIQI
jgi:aspartate dehydrogenase